MIDEDPSSLTTEMLVEITADIVSAYISNNAVPAADLPALIASVHTQVGALSQKKATNDVLRMGNKPAVDPAKSVFDDYIICLEDGLKFKTLRRHLMRAYGLTPDAYREKWGLPRNYPVVAPNYAIRRSQLARENGLGRKNATSK